jgi:hypothetical protein
MRLILIDNAAIGRNADFAIGEGIKSVDGLVDETPGAS